MTVNRGKQFEEQIKESFQKAGICIDRFPDPMAGFAGIRNICDFGVFTYPYYLYIECKAIHIGTLNFKSHITKDQWSGMIEKAKFKGTMPCIIVWYVEEDRTYLVPIIELDRLQKEGKKSLNIKDIQACKVFCYDVEGRKKRILYDYDGESLNNKIHEHMTKYEELLDKWQKTMN